MTNLLCANKFPSDSAELNATITIAPTSATLSFEEVIENYKNTVYSIALTHTGNKADAEDVFQDVFLIYFKKAKQFADEEHRKAWLIRTTLNRAKKTSSSLWKKRSTTLDESVATSSSSGNNWQFSLERQNDVFAAMRTLPETYRTVLHLFYFEDLPTAQIAELVGTKESTLRVQLKRARELMREKLSQDYFYD